MRELSHLEGESYDHLVYVRIFEGCNLRCKHCFIPANPKKMDMEDVRDIPNKLKGKVPTGAKVLLQWHGGEPTLLGPRWLKEAIEIVESCTEYEWVHGIQTNLLTYDREWRELYKEYFKGRVGVSYDPKIRVYNGDPNSNDRFENKFWGNFAELVQDGLEPYVIITGTNVFFKTYRNPYDLFNLMQSKGFKKMHIERITETGYARMHWDLVGVNNSDYAKNMSRIARAYVNWKKSPDYSEYFISPFDDLITSAKQMDNGVYQSYGCLSGKCDTRFHTIDANGYKFGCTALNSEDDNKHSNNKLNINLSNISKDRVERTVYNCNLCEFRPICISGCLAVDFDDGSGECSGGRSLLNEIKHLSRN